MRFRVKIDAEIEADDIMDVFSRLGLYYAMLGLEMSPVTPYESGAAQIEPVMTPEAPK